MSATPTPEPLPIAEEPACKCPSYQDVAYVAGLFADVMFAAGVAGESLRAIVVMADSEDDSEAPGCVVNARSFLACAEARLGAARSNFDSLFGKEEAS